MSKSASAERGAAQLDEFFQSADSPQHYLAADNAVGMPDDVPEYVTEAIDYEPDSKWTAPKQLVSELLPVAQFTPELMPKVLADYVLDEAERMPCPPDYVAAALVVALGSVIGARCALKPKRHDDSWLVTANLWGGVVGEPSAKKTPAISAGTRNLDRLEAVEADKLLNKLAIYDAELAAHVAVKNAIESEMKKAVTAKVDAKEKDDRLAAAKHALAGLQAPEKPYQRRFKVNDGTVEKIGDLLTTNPAGFLVLRDELTGLLDGWEKPGHECDRAFYLESWNGTGSFNIDRIGRGSQLVPNLCLSVFGGIQPDLLARYLAGILNSFDNDGRIQRFQVMVYPDPTPWHWEDRAPARGSRRAMRDIFDHLANFDPVMDGARAADEFVKLPYFSFDDAAQDMFIEWSHDLHNRIDAEENPIMRQHLAKFEKLFCSLALIFHLAEGHVGEVKVDMVLYAAAYCQYLESHARRIYDMVNVARISAAQTLGRRLAEGKLTDGFTARDVGRKRWSGLSSMPQVQAALDILEEYGWVRSTESGGNRGRPTTQYWINPLVQSAK